MTQAWPIRALYVPGHNECIQELTMTQARPVNIALGLSPERIGKKVFPPAVLKLKAPTTRASECFLATPWRKPAWEWGSHRGKWNPESKRGNFFQYHFSTWIWSNLKHEPLHFSATWTNALSILLCPFWVRSLSLAFKKDLPKTQPKALSSCLHLFLSRLNSHSYLIGNFFFEYFLYSRWLRFNMN